VNEIKTSARLSNIPEAQFDKQIEAEAPPTISQLAQQGLKPHP